MAGLFCVGIRHLNSLLAGLQNIALG
jgi:hypothetical protein